MAQCLLKSALSFSSKSSPTLASSLSENIVCICTDGASVMAKVGKLIKADQQLCFAHGIQLAV